jgi:DNA (cytosine-5)-methyltransferase 1
MRFLTMQSEKLKVLDLFSGIGGFSLGLERTGGFKTVAFCEIEEYPRKVLAKHWPDVPIYKDVRNVTGERLVADGIAPDIITGGFPCQDLSSAGQRSGIFGDRSGLWGEIIRLMGDIRPKFMLFENVAGLLTGDGGRWFDRLLTDLASIGYILEWECISAAQLGAPHKRERIYGIAYPSENGWLRLQIKAGSQVRRDLGNNIRIDWRDSGLGAWTDWARGIGKNEIHGQSLIAGKDDGVSGWVDRNSACGNSVLPAIPEMIGYAILEAEKHSSDNDKEPNNGVS